MTGSCLTIALIDVLAVLEGHRRMLWELIVLAPWQPPSRIVLDSCHVIVLLTAESDDGNHGAMNIAEEHYRVTTTVRHTEYIRGHG